MFINKYLLKIECIRTDKETENKEEEKKTPSFKTDTHVFVKKKEIRSNNDNNNNTFLRIKVSVL